jgi:hypothetical protein
MLKIYGLKVQKSGIHDFFSEASKAKKILIFQFWTNIAVPKKLLAGS